MKTRPILFNSEMVQALLAGRKTQTRRVLKGFDINRLTTRANFADSSPYPLSRKETPGYHYAVLENGSRVGIPCPYGKPDDCLWVRETCRAKELTEGPAFDGVLYLADNEFIVIQNTVEASNKWVDLNYYGGAGGRGAVVPSIHMPRWASRITLLVKNVRLEQLQDISEEDAVAEGLKIFNEDDANLYYSGTAPIDKWPDGWDLTATRAYKDLWDSINKNGGKWISNPWVWVVEFELFKKNVEEFKLYLREKNVRV